MSAGEQEPGTLDALLSALAEDWAQLPASEDGDALALAYLRAAYGLGYVHALEGQTQEASA